MLERAVKLHIATRTDCEYTDINYMYNDNGVRFKLENKSQLQYFNDQVKRYLPTLAGKPLAALSAVLVSLLSF